MNFLKTCISLIFFASLLGSCKSESDKKIATSLEIGKTAQTVIPIKNPAQGNSALPRLFGNEKQLFMSWIEKRDTISILYFASLKDGKWTKPVEVNSGSDWFINWADFPAIAENNGNILISYLQKSANGKYTYDAKLNLYSAETKTWEKDILLHNDGTESEHGFVSVVPKGKSSFYAIWLDGRNTIANSEGHDHHGSGAMSLRGRLIHPDGSMQPSVELDNSVCDCCQTAITAVNGDPLMVYRDRSGDEMRDIARIGLFEDSFSKSELIFPDKWKIPGCPVNGPAIASFKNNAVVAWFTGVNDNPKVQISFSKDSGKTFAAPIRINKNATLGRVDVVMPSENTAIVSWMENLGEETYIQAMRVSANGTKGFPVTISKTSFERSSGFPQLEISGNRLYAAWTMVEGKQSTIKTASIAMADL